MKKIILISILIIICNSVNAVYIDSLENIALLHCDTASTNFWDLSMTNYWLVTPDDNSSGRPACEPILNKTNVGEFVMDSATIPTFVPGSPKGGDYLSFDGVDDSLYVNNGWVGDNSAYVDLSMRWLGLPPTNDVFAGIAHCMPWRCYFANLDGEARLGFLMLPGELWLISDKILESNVWYDIHFSWFEHNMTLIVGDTTNTGFMADDLDQSATHVTVGYGYWVPTRVFKGDLDELRWGYIVPEPTLFLILVLIPPFLKWVRGI